MNSIQAFNSSELWCIQRREVGPACKDQGGYVHGFIHCSLLVKELHSDQLQGELGCSRAPWGSRSTFKLLVTRHLIYFLAKPCSFSKESCALCFFFFFLLLPTTFSLGYSSRQSFTRPEWKSCIKVFLSSSSSFVGKPWVLKFGWISNARFLICLRELYLCFQLRLSSLQYTFGFGCVMLRFSAWPGRRCSNVRGKEENHKRHQNHISSGKTKTSDILRTAPIFLVTRSGFTLTSLWVYNSYNSPVTVLSLLRKICKDFPCNPSLPQRDLILCCLGSNSVWERDEPRVIMLQGNTDGKHYH